MRTTTTDSLSTAKKVFLFIACVAVPLLVGFASNLLAGDVKGKYNALAQPPLAPPDWLFGVVWTALYALMGIALFIVIVSSAPVGRKLAGLALFVAQIVVNYAWNPVFFRGSYWVAVGIILLLAVLVVAMLTVFWRANKVAGVLTVPYLAWILFATYLNISFAILN